MGLSLKDIGKAINKGANTLVDIGQGVVSGLPGGGIANNLIDLAQTVNFNGGGGSTPAPANPQVQAYLELYMAEAKKRAAAIKSKKLADGGKILEAEAAAAGKTVQDYLMGGQATKTMAAVAPIVAKSGASANIGDILKNMAGGALAAAGGTLMGTKDGGDIGANALDSTIGTFFKRHWWKILLGVGAVTAVIVYVVRRGKSGKGKNFH